MNDTQTDSKHEPRHLTTAEAALRMGLSTETVRRMCVDGVLAGAYRERSTGPWCIPQDAVEKWAKANRREGRWRPISRYLAKAVAVLVTLFALLEVISVLADFGGAEQRVREWGKALGLLKDFPVASADETLIVIATFHHTEGVIDTDAHNEIRRAIEKARDELGTPHVRVEVESARLLADDRSGAEKLGKRYNASMIIWGADTGLKVAVNFLNLKNPLAVAGAVRIDETERAQLVNPSGYAGFILRDMPGQITFLALFALGQSYYIRQGYVGSGRVIEQAIASLPSTDTQLEGLAEAYFLLGRVQQLLDGEPARAIGYYDRAIQLNPSFVGAYNNRGIARRAAGDLVGAISDYNHALDISPDLALVYLNRAHARMEQNDYTGAIDDLDQAVELDPRDSDAHVSRGNARQSQGDLAGAISDYDQAISLDGKNALAYYNRGNAYYDQGHIDAAISDFGEAIVLNPSDARSFNNRGSARKVQGDLVGAISDLNQAIILDPEYALAYYNRGNVRYDQHDLPGAITDYDQAIRIDPNYANAYYRRGNIYRDQDDLVRAIADYNQAITLDAGLAEAYNNRGTVRYDQGDLIGAIADYNQALHLNPKLAQAYNNRGNAHKDQGDIASAINDYSQAIRLNPNDAAAYSNRGNAQSAQGDVMNAIADFDQAIMLNPDLPEPYFNRGVARKTDGDLTGAITDLRRYLQLRPAAVNRGEVEELINELEAILSAR